MSRDAYAPIFSSPLNPSSPPSTDDGQTRRTRPHSATAPRPKRVASPSQKLMRKKAAEAWKSEALRRQVAEYERQTLEALSAKRPLAQTLACQPKCSGDAEQEDESEQQSQTKSLPFLQMLSLGAVMPNQWNRSINPIWVFSSKRTKRKTLQS